MFSRIKEALASKRNGESMKGFTLIELVVVVLIIGILAAVAVPQFLAQRQRAYDSATQSDARNLVTALESYYASELMFPGDPSTLAKAGDSWDTVARRGGATSSDGVAVWVLFGQNSGSAPVSAKAFQDYVVVAQNVRNLERIYALQSFGNSTPVRFDTDSASNDAGDFETVDGLTLPEFIEQPNLLAGQTAPNFKSSRVVAVANAPAATDTTSGYVTPASFN